MRPVLPLLLTIGCGGLDPATPTGHDPTPTGEGQGGYCAVERLFAQQCSTCHSAASALGDLDLETDLRGALVGVTSAAFGAVLVQPSDPDGSLLVRKLEGTQTAEEGGVMPPASGSLPAPALELVRTWVADGATTECGSDVPTLPTEPLTVHPEGWADAASHGLATKLQTGAEADCTECHGDDLSGGKTGIACDDCHDPGWASDCTYCHGGELDNSGAPPRDLDGTTDPAELAFRPHAEHQQQVVTEGMTCVTCHTAMPASALSAGHVFGDATPGIADVTFSGISAGGTSADGSCTVYCHSDGQLAAGTVSSQAPAMGCDGCHPDASSPRAALEAMSGLHEHHVLGKGIACATCHGPVLDDSGAIALPERHIDGTVDVTLPSGMTWDAPATTCLGTCHWSQIEEPAEHSIAENRYLWQGEN